MKRSISISAFALLLVSCHQKDVDVNIPFVLANFSENRFLTKQGITYFDQQPFSGWQFSLYENGDTASITPFFHGKEWGIARQWYPGKVLKAIRSYIDGKKTGEHKSWWDNGKPKYLYHFTNDEYDGELKEWFPNGQICREMNYKNGHESGLQRIWRQDGFLYANYEVRNGRNYGLTGRMHCKNIWKDEM